MRFPALLRFAVGGLWRQPGRTLLTVGGVAVGVCGLVFSLALGVGLTAFVDREFRSRPQFWTVHVMPGRGAPVADAAIPADAVAVPGEMSAERRTRLQKLKRDEYRRGHPAGPPTRLTPEAVAALAAVPGVERVDAWHQHPGAVGLTADGPRKTVTVVSGPAAGLAPRLLAGRLPAGNEAVVSERLLYDLGLTDESQVAAAFGRPLTVTFAGRPPGKLAVGFGGDLSESQEAALGRVTAALPQVIAALDLSPTEKAGLNKLLAAPARAERFAVPEPVVGRPVLVGVVRDLTDAERHAPDGPESGAERYGEVFLAPPAGDPLFARLPWVREVGYTSASVRVVPGGDLPGVVAACEAGGFDTLHLLKFYQAGRTQVVLTAAGLNLFALLAVGVAALGITNTLVTSVVERTREIGILRAVGATSGQVRGLFLAEGAAVGLLGGLLGLLLAAALSHPAEGLIHRLIARASVEPTGGGAVVVFPPWLPPAGVGFAVLATTLAAWYPARRAGRLDPGAAIR
jgi:putative ABC transport system permease protein